MMFGSKKTLVVSLFLMISSMAMSVDYFRLNLLWPNSYCNSGDRVCKQPIPQRFIIHGLWPHQADHKHARPCTGFYFSKSDPARWNFSDSLSSFWPNLLEGRKEINLWQWEWNKYGVCSDMKAESYFYLAVKYARKYENLYDSLLESGVVFTSSQPYKIKVLYDEVTKAVGSSPIITCNEYKNLKQLMDICICIDIKGVAMDCPFSFNSCGGSKYPILFPTKETINILRRDEHMVEEIPSTSQLRKLIVNHSRSLNDCYPYIINAESLKTEDPGWNISNATMI